jgi:hypothetical protein
MRIALACRAAVLLALVIGATSAESLTLTEARKCTPREKCCKVCSTGKACGDSCISKKYTCHKKSGCACDSSGVCK